MPNESAASYEQRFSAFFAREVAQKAAASLVNGAEIELRITALGEEPDQVLTFTRVRDRNEIVAGAPKSPQVAFTLSPSAADAVLSIDSTEIGEIGVQIAKLILAPDPTRKIGLKIHAGILSLITKGYLGVIAAGGASFASYLASKGFNGMGAIKAALGKKKD